MNLIYFPLLLLIPCLSYANDCKFDLVPSTTPSSRFSDNGDGTVYDKKTGLTWKKCTEGLWGENCELGTSKDYGYGAALYDLENINSYAGYHDWRIPNIKELFSIVEDACSSPSINESIFPNTENWFYLSSTPNYEVDFGGGLISTFGMRYERHLRLVRSME